MDSEVKNGNREYLRTHGGPLKAYYEFNCQLRWEPHGRGSSLLNYFKEFKPNKMLSNRRIWKHTKQIQNENVCGTVLERERTERERRAAIFCLHLFMPVAFLTASAAPCAMALICWPACSMHAGEYHMWTLITWQRKKNENPHQRGTGTTWPDRFDPTGIEFDIYMSLDNYFQYLNWTCVRWLIVS